MSAPSIARECERCGGAFRTYPSYIRRGGGRFCSHGCANRSAGGTASWKERFWLYVGPPSSTGCLLWLGVRYPNGYGRLWLGGGRHAGAHRVAWELTHAPIPDDLCVMHRCDVPACVNVEHLFLGTVADNVADMVAKGRSAHGRRHPLAKLTDDAVRAIRAAASEVTQVQLAREFGVSQSTISAVLGRVTWKHVS